MPDRRMRGDAGGFGEIVYLCGATPETTYNLIRYIMKRLLIIVAVALLANAASAQPVSLGIGIKAGVNVSNLTHSDYRPLDAKYKASYYVGIYKEFKIGRFAIQPEVIYSRQGNRYKDGDAEMTNKLNYLNIPVMFKYYFLKRFSIDVGPQFGILLNAKTDAENVGGVLSGNHSISDDCKSTDISLSMGLSCRIVGKLNVSARYNHGFTKVFRESARISDSAKNRVFQIGVGVQF